MKKEEIIDLLKEKGQKQHTNEWTCAVLLTNEIINKMYQIQNLQVNLGSMKEELNMVAEQEATPKIKEYLDEENRLHSKIIKMEQLLNQNMEIHHLLSSDISKIRKQVDLSKQQIFDLKNKESELKNEKHYLKKLEKHEDIESNQKILEKKKQKLQKLNKKQEKHDKQLKVLENKKSTLENAPNQIVLEAVDLAVFEAPIPSRKGSFSENTISTDDINTTVHSTNDEDFDDDIISNFNLNRISLKKTLNEIHEKSITSIKFSHDKSYFATGGDDGVILVHKYSHDQIKQFTKLSNLDSEIVSLDFSPDDENFLAACSDLTIRVYRTKKWTPILENNHIKKKINHAEFFNSNSQYILCGKGNTIKIFDVNKTKPTSKFKSSSHPYYVTSSLGENLLLSGHSDSSVIIWDSRTGKQTNGYKFNKGKVIQVIASPTYNAIASLSINKVICLTDTRNLNLIKKIDVSCTNINSTKNRMSLKDKSIVIGGQNGVVYSWSLLSHQLVSQKKISDSPISTVEIKHESNKMAVGDAKGNIYFYC